MIKFAPTRDFEAAGSMYLANASYTVGGELEDRVRRWHGAGLVQMDGEPLVPARPGVIAITVGRPREIAATGHPRGERILTLAPTIAVDYEPQDTFAPDTIKVVLLPYGWTDDELRLMLDQAFALIKASRSPPPGAP